MPTPKQSAKEAIQSERHSDDKYSVESLRANMSTGGGEPIEKGHKLTDERRVLQPRDPDTGQFEFNSSANYGRKYPDRSKDGHAPIAARGWVLGKGIKKGDKVNIGGKVWIAIDSIDKDKLVDFFKNYDEKTGEFFSGNERLSDKFIRKHGRESKEEKAGIAANERVVGNVNLSSLGAMSQKDMQDKMVKAAQGLKSGAKYSLEFLDSFGNEKDDVNPDAEAGFLAATDWDKYVANAKANYMKDEGAVHGRYGEDKNNNSDENLKGVFGDDNVDKWKKERQDKLQREAQLRQDHDKQPNENAVKDERKENKNTAGNGNLNNTVWNPEKDGYGNNLKRRDVDYEEVDEDDVDIEELFK